MIESGIIKKDYYNKVVKSELFKELENYSDEFSKLQKELFPEFSKQWVKDSFHQWSRQYEYPFVYKYLSGFNIGEGRILDAGSGITFFPYMMSSKGITIECCDHDTKLKEQFVRVNNKLNKKIEYFNADISHIEKPDEFYDAVYCISVLEHTVDHGSILKEFSRIIKSNGHLVITFDISIDGSADIPFHKAKELLDTIKIYFDPIEASPDLSQEVIESDSVLTTRYINKYNKDLLPWRYPYLMFFKSLSKGKIPKYLLRNLTCYCGVYKKK